LASRVIAKILKDEKRDNELSKGISTGTFFGGRALIRGAAQLAGKYTYCLTLSLSLLVII